MSETYDAVYHVVSRAFSGFCPSSILENATRNMDISHYANMASHAVQEAAMEYTRPSVTMRPKVFMDGDKWCALYGDNLQDGVAGFGVSPSKAMYDFDTNWSKSPTQQSIKE